MFCSDILGVIHAKGTSERVSRKNHCLLDGVPLFLCQALNLATLIGKTNVFVDSEDDEILRLAEENGFKTLRRNESLASNTTGGVSLLANFLNSIPESQVPKTVVQLFPPMPIVDIEALEIGLDAVHKLETHNSAFFVGKEKFYSWSEEKPLYGEIGEEIPNSVELDPILYEIPTAYIVNVKAFLQLNSRICAPQKKLITKDASYQIDIDEESDFLIASAVSKLPHIKRSFNFFDQARLYYPPIIFWDADGTLTDGWYNSSYGKELFKSFHTYDGIALKTLAGRGVKNCIVTASKSSEIIQQRSVITNVHVLYDINDKLKACRDFAAELGFNIRECYYVGNDVNDLIVMGYCGRSFCPSDSDRIVQQTAEVLPISASEGGVAKAILERLTTEKAIMRRI